MRVTFPSYASDAFSFAWKMELLLPSYQPSITAGNPGWLTFGVDCSTGSILSTWLDPNKRLYVTVTNSDGDVTYSEICAYRDLLDLCEALSTNDRNCNVLAENGLFDAKQVISITQE